MSTIKEKLAALQIDLPSPRKPTGTFVTTLISEDMLYISGQIAIDKNGSVISGKLGFDLDIEQGQAAARRCAIGVLAQAEDAIGNLDNIKKVIKLGGYVNAADTFMDHPKVINGASDLMVDVFGTQIGSHVRFAVGCSSLPSNSAVEVEAIFKLML